MTDVDTSAPAAAGPGPKTEGQALLDRMLEQCNRYNKLRKRLDDVRGSIAPGKSRRAAVEPGAPPAPATSFFEALKMLADGNDQVAEELEDSIVEIERLF